MSALTNRNLENATMKKRVSHIAGLIMLSAALTATAQSDLDLDMTDNDEVIELHTAELDGYRDAIKTLEETGGAYATGLSEELLGLGLALQRSGRHAQAVEVFQRGTHITRINQGLYSEQQIPFLKGSINSLAVLQDIRAADDQQEYLIRVQERALKPGPERISAWLEYAYWQRSQFLRAPVDTQFPRLIKMLDAYQSALNELKTFEDERQLVADSLWGLIQTYFLVTSFDDEKDASPFERRTNFDENAPQENFYEFYRDADRGAPQAIELLVHLLSEIHGPTSFEAFHASIQLADWHLWRGERRTASELYRQIDQVIGELEDETRIQELRDQLFNRVTLLPDIQGIRLLPPAVPTEEGNVSLSFNITDRGTVRNVKRVEVAEGFDGLAGKFIRYLRHAVFRPQVLEGASVTREGVEQSYVLQDD
jgi:tetratricopeptide (TPR) repeat protein